MYQEDGPDYIHAILNGYTDPPAGFALPPGGQYNKYFPGGAIGMPKPLSDGQVEYTDGTPTTVDQYGRDVAAFLMWAAEPKLDAAQTARLPGDDIPDRVYRAVVLHQKTGLACRAARSRAGTALSAERVSALSVAGDRRVQIMTSIVVENDLKAAIRTIPDYPKPGIMFRDITTLLGDARAFRRAVDELVQPWAGSKIDKVAGIEARGFILGGAIAHQVSCGFVPIRKKGKLPFKRVSIGYSLEYGIDEMEMHEDAVVAGERVILVDDLVATGGTAEAAVKLLQQIGANVVAACFVIDLPELGGAAKIRKLGVPVRTLVSFEGH